jgi:hypothetical protein
MQIQKQTDTENKSRRTALNPPIFWYTEPRMRERPKQRQVILEQWKSETKVYDHLHFQNAFTQITFQKLLLISILTLRLPSIFLSNFNSNTNLNFYFKSIWANYK